MSLSSLSCVSAVRRAAATGPMSSESGASRSCETASFHQRVRLARRLGDGRDQVDGETAACRSQAGRAAGDLGQAPARTLAASAVVAPAPAMAFDGIARERPATGIQETARRSGPRVRVRSPARRAPAPAGRTPSLPQRLPRGAGSARAPSWSVPAPGHLGSARTVPVNRNAKSPKIASTVRSPMSHLRPRWRRGVNGGSTSGSVRTACPGRRRRPIVVIASSAGAPTADMVVGETCDPCRGSSLGDTRARDNRLRPIRARSVFRRCDFGPKA